MISLEVLKKVAKLARLSLRAGEVEAYPKQFSAILGYFEQISEVNTTQIEPLLTPTEIAPTWRADQAEVWETSEVALANAPERSGNLFKVPPVV